MANANNLFQTHPTKVITGKGRLSFAFIWEPRDQDDGSKKYSTSFLIPKSDVRTLTNIQQAVNNAIVHGRAKGFWNDKLPPNFKTPLRDGDLEADEKGDEYRGCFFINATSLNAPRVVDTAIQDILDRDEVYSGCFARLSINLYPFNTNGNKGVACGLNHVQKLHDGDPLSAARSKPEEDFNNFDDGSGDLPFPGEPGYDGPEPPPAYPPQGYNYPPQQAGQMPQGQGYPMQQPPAAYAPPQAPAGYPGMQQASAGYPQQQAQQYGYPQQQMPAGYPGAQQAPNGYPPAQQAPVGYPPQQQMPAGYPGAQQAPNGYPMGPNPAASFNEQLAAASSVLPPDLFGDELKRPAA